MKRRELLIVPALVLGLAWLACGVPISHIYSGHLYDPDADCLYPGSAVDPALEGPPVEAGSCDTICITDLDGDVWLSEQCPPYPTIFDLKGDAPGCAKARAARCRQCAYGDGGRLMILCDAGADDAPSEGATDGPTDAPVDAAKDARGERGKD